jgi:hypothetical protein
VQTVFERFRIAEYTVIDAHGQPITWPVTPRYSPGAPFIDVHAAKGHPKKADDARANSLVSLLFSEPKGSDVADPPMVLVQGSADVPGSESHGRDPICVHVRPERVYVWAGGVIEDDPVVYGAHMEEVRSGHSEEPSRYHADPAGGMSRWDRRLSEIGSRHTSGVLSLVSPDGFPFSIRVPIALDPAQRWINVASAPAGTPLQPGLACLTVHERGEELDWEHSFHVRCDLLDSDHGWVLLPHKVFDGAELENLSS